MRKIISVILGLIIVIGLVTAIGIGVTPSTVTYPPVLRGINYTALVEFQNLAEDTMVVDLSLDNYSEWFDIPSQFTIPPLEQGIPGKIQIPFNLQVPRNAPLGDYSTDGHAMGAIILNNTNGTVINVGITFNVSFEVIEEEIINLEVDYILSSDVIQGQDWLARARVNNEGNVPVEPMMNVVIKKSGIVIDTINEQFTVEVGEDKELSITADSTSWDIGSYSADISVSLDSETLMAKTVYFQVIGYNINEVNYIQNDTFDVVVNFENMNNFNIQPDVTWVLNKENEVLYSLTKQFDVPGRDTQDLILSYNATLDIGEYDSLIRVTLWGRPLGEYTYTFAIEDACHYAVPTDINCDGVTDLIDLEIVKAFKKCSKKNNCEEEIGRADVDQDGDVDKIDVDLVLEAIQDNAAPTDLNYDGITDWDDFEIVTSFYKCNKKGNCKEDFYREDIDQDGDVDIRDLIAVLYGMLE